MIFCFLRKVYQLCRFWHARLSHILIQQGCTVNLTAFEYVIVQKTLDKQARSVPFNLITRKQSRAVNFSFLFFLKENRKWSLIGEVMIGLAAITAFANLKEYYQNHRQGGQPCNSAGTRNLEDSKKQIMFHFT
jgi:hypothetical protein